MFREILFVFGLSSWCSSNDSSTTALSKINHDDNKPCKTLLVGGSYISENIDWEK